MSDKKVVTVTLKLSPEQHSLLKMIVAKEGITLQEHISKLIQTDMCENWGYSTITGKIESEKLFK
ncbi:MAG: hypothetical protein LBM93_01515 [Oscillospiraceae bacterium]|jgi:predicted DNA binding CopG/RHH family protein|nr:hypothetical protein [Oscillospiraceae bacterium]